MEQSKQGTMAEQEAAKRRKERADKFWNIFLFTDGHGRLKSTTVIYSFFISVLFLAVYGVLYMLLIDALNDLLGPGCPVWLANTVESLVPAILGSLLCNALFYAVKQKKLIIAGYAWLILYALVLLVGVLVGMDAGDWGMFLSLYALVVPAPILLGLGLAIFLTNRYNTKQSGGRALEPQTDKRS